MLYLNESIFCSMFRCCCKWRYWCPSHTSKFHFRIWQEGDVIFCVFKLDSCSPRTLLLMSPSLILQVKIGFPFSILFRPFVVLLKAQCNGPVLCLRIPFQSFDTTNGYFHPMAFPDCFWPNWSYSQTRLYGVVKNSLWSYEILIWISVCIILNWTLIHYSNKP